MVDAVADKPAPAAKRRFFRRNGAENLSVGQLAAYGSLAIPYFMVQGPVNMFLAPYFTGELGVTLTTWALVLGITRMVDLFTDPVVGMICDRLPSKWGRRRHWIVISAAPMMMACALLFAPLLFTQNVTFWYVLCALLLYNLAQTIMGLNSTAWGGELSTRYEARNHIMGWRMFFANFSKLMAYGLPAIMEWMIPGATLAEKIYALMWLSLIVTPVIVLIAVLSVPERPIEAGVRQAAMSLRDVYSTLKAMLGNKYFRGVVLIELLHAGPISVQQGLFVFYLTYVIEAPHLLGTTLLCLYASSLVATPVWVWLSKGREKHKLLACGIFMFALCQGSMLFWGPATVGFYIAVQCLTGVANRGSAFLMQSIMADVVDSDVAKTGKQQTGAFFAVLETTAKLAPTLALIALFPLLEMGGFDPTGKNNTPESIDLVRRMMAFTPFIPSLFAAYLLWTFPLGSRRQRELREEIAARALSRDTPPA